MATKIVTFGVNDGYEEVIEFSPLYRIFFGGCQLSSLCVPPAIAVSVTNAKCIYRYVRSYTYVY